MPSPGKGQVKPEQLEIDRLRKKVAKFKAERDMLKKATQTEQPIHQRTVPTADDRQWRNLLNEPVGHRLDNAAMESFFSSLNAERISKKVYRTRDQARTDVFDYVEGLYNPKKRHSTLGYPNSACRA